MPTLGGAATLILPSVPEQLVEGHTVFLTIEGVREQTAEEEFAAAVAILVRDRTQTQRNQRFPGVLWFNDEYLVEPDQTVRKARVAQRFPCDGVLIGVNRGDPVDHDPAGRPTLHNATYNESYFITDPNEHVWQVDLWNTRHDTLAWTVGILNGASGEEGEPDDGKRNCATYRDTHSLCTSHLANLTDRCAPTFFGADRGLQHQDPGDHGMGYPCEDCAPLQYNALLYFRMDHLAVYNRSKDHREYVGDDWWNDTSGCHDDSTGSWSCPGDDDAREGNSHPYNPDTMHPFVPYDGKNNHGGSDYCVPDGNLEDCHATFDIDLYYGYHEPPPEYQRRYYVYDLQGAEAPYHCHEDNMPCDFSHYNVPP